MPKSESEIKKEIKEFIERNNGGYSSWYVGISENPRERLFDDHNVDEKNGWIYREASNSEIARRIEKYFIDELGTDGGAGGGDVDAKYVYAYSKKADTNP